MFSELAVMMHTSMPLGGTLNQKISNRLIMMVWAYGMVAVHVPETRCDNRMTILHYHIICFVLCLFILLMPDVSLGYQGMYKTFCCYWKVVFPFFFLICIGGGVES
jgi:hypothetical protein